MAPSRPSREIQCITRRRKDAKSQCRMSRFGYSSSRTVGEPKLPPEPASVSSCSLFPPPSLGRGLAACTGSSCIFLRWRRAWENSPMAFCTRSLGWTSHPAAKGQYTQEFREGFRQEIAKPAGRFHRTTRS